MKRKTIKMSFRRKADAHVEVVRAISRQSITINNQNHQRRNNPAKQGDLIARSQTLLLLLL
jgi:hypothetical protein